MRAPPTRRAAARRLELRVEEANAEIERAQARRAGGGGIRADPAVADIGNDFQRYRHLGGFELRRQLAGLAGGHDLVLRAMDQQHRRVLGIDMGGRARGRDTVGGTSALLAVEIGIFRARNGRMGHGRKIIDAIPAHSGLDAVALFGMRLALTAWFAPAIQRGERGQLPARRTAPDGDAARIDAIARGIALEEAHGGAHVIDRGRERRFLRQPIFQRGHDIAARGQVGEHGGEIAERAGLPRMAIHPAAAMHIDDQRQRGGSLRRTVEVQDQGPIARDGRIGDVGADADAVRQGQYPVGHRIAQGRFRRGGGTGRLRRGWSDDPGQHEKRSDGLGGMKAHISLPHGLQLH